MDPIVSVEAEFQLKAHRAQSPMQMIGLAYMLALAAIRNKNIYIKIGPVPGPQN
jgi:hypothetical protein